MQAHEPNTWHARSGRLNEGKRRALAELGPRWAPPAPPSDAVAIELGAGTGEAALALAAARPDLAVIAAEVHLASLATFLRRAETAQPANLRIAPTDGRALVAAAEPRTLRLVRAFFPDPWPKRRQQRRRLVQPRFVALLAAHTTAGAIVELCTDDASYAAQMAAAFATSDAFTGGTGPRAERPVTHYERLAQEAGRPVVDLRFVRTGRGGAS